LSREEDEGNTAPLKLITYLARVVVNQFIAKDYRTHFETSERPIQPCNPIPAKIVPAGEGWVHKVKFDGYRIQVHKTDSLVIIFR